MGLPPSVQAALDARDRRSEENEARAQERPDNAFNQLPTDLSRTSAATRTARRSAHTR
jgi:hypothetical protein